MTRNAFATPILQIQEAIEGLQQTSSGERSLMRALAHLWSALDELDHARRDSIARPARAEAAVAGGRRGALP